MRYFHIGLIAALVAASSLSAQVGGPPAPARPGGVPQEQQPPPPPQPAPPAAAPAQNPAPPAPAQTTPAAALRLTENGTFMMDNVSLTEMVDALARQLKINVILDPRVRGAVTVHTYGEVKPVDLMPLLETLLRVNGATMVKVGDLYRVIPINLVSQLPLEPTVNADPKTLPDDERMLLNLIFLKFATASEIEKLITPFLGEGAAHSSYEPANLIILEDNSRNMKRTMELISLFDSDSFAGQRVRLYDIQHSRPADLVKDLETVFKAYALSEKAGSVRFIPIDRINTLIAVAPNPGVFSQVEDWIKKLDIPVKITAGAVTNYVYRLKYARAEMIAMAIMALYSGNPAALIGLANMANASMINSGLGYGGAMGGAGYGGSMGYGGASFGGGAYQNYPNTYGGQNYNVPFGAQSFGGAGGAPISATGVAPAVAGGAVPGTDLTGSYLGTVPGGVLPGGRLPHVIPNPFDNTLLIQGTPQEYEEITNLLRQLDVPPRQVLIDAKIYEVDLTGALAGGVESFLQKRGASSGSGSGGPAATRTLQAFAGAAGLTLTTGALVLKSHELLAVLNAEETRTHVRVVSAPSIMATDSIPATMNVGDQVPVLTSQAVVGGVQSGGSSVFANTVSNQASGVTLSITARVNPSGVVTLVINQQVSAPEPAPPGVTNASTSFSNRSISTQLTVEDGDTVAIGGIITDKRTESSGGVPILHRIPVMGAAFGAKSYSTSRTELIIFLTPRVIYDTSQIIDATDELKSNLKRVQKLMKD
ncbi:MAG: type II secretion system protein GspD [Terriglobia bacterium]|nr:MAG: type II secretion system protein GspD [Terriglobia bacterium]